LDAGFLGWAIGGGAIDRALERTLRAVMLSSGDPGPFAEFIREARAGLILQVTGLEEARQGGLGAGMAR